MLLIGYSPASPKLLRSQLCALGHSLELSPDHGRMDLRGKGSLRREPAVTPGDDVLASHQPGVIHQPFSDEFRVLDDVAGVADHARNEHLTLWEFDLLPDVPFVRVARVCRLKGV